MPHENTTYTISPVEKLMSNDERIKELQEKRDDLSEEYRKLIMKLSDLQDQISDYDGDIRMLEYEQEKKSP
jgi:chromosome segregation ATPase